MSYSYIKKNSIKCYFCNGDHICRECPKESKVSPIFKRKIGDIMEHWIANNFKCPGCKCAQLNVIGNHTPSLDIICKKCLMKIEVKSKCLSVQKLPSDIKLPHGSYIDYIQRLKENLNLIVIIYGVDRINKNISIREVLYANNFDLKNPAVIKVDKRPDSNLSTIFIKNKTKLINLDIETDNTIISFKDNYNSLMS
jgi:hypothetical protein